MENSSDDDGDPAGPTLTKASLIVLFLLPLSVYKPLQPVVLVKGIEVEQKQKALPPKTIVVKPKSKRKKLYITFDDGPNKGTKNVLTIVKDEQVPVSFFIVGEHVFASTAQGHLWDSLKLMQQVDLCNHSFSHAKGRYERFYQNPDSVVKDFARTHDSLDLQNTISRTPGRNIWRIDTLSFTDLTKSKAAADSLQKAGFILMGWDLEWHFNHKTMSVSHTAEQMVNAIDSTFKYNKTKNKDHLVLLAHDQAYAKSDDSLQLRQFLQLLKKKEDYELSLVTTYPGAERIMLDSLKLK